MLISLFSLALTACSSYPSSITASPSAQAFTRGNVTGSQQPLVGAVIQFYAAGSTGIGSGAVPLLDEPVQTDANGSFSLPSGQPKCRAASDLVYVVATGGTTVSGAPSNKAAGLLAAVGPCSTIDGSTFLKLNELTTVASIWSLAPFMSSGSAVGADPAHIAALTTAFEEVQSFIDLRTASVPGPALPNGWTLPLANFNTLANILSACTTSAGGTAGDGTPCGRLFSLAKSASNSVPDNVLDASLIIAKNPAQNVGSIFALSPAAAPWQPALSDAPTDWTLRLMGPGDAATNALATKNGSGSQKVTPMKLAFATQPVSTSVGLPLPSPVSVVVEDSSGNVITNATNHITLTLVGGSSSTATVSGNLAASAGRGLASFSSLAIGTVGENYHFMATSPGLSPASSATFSITPLMTGSSFVVPSSNACNSKYDKFYMAEPGVYAYWGLCETASSGTPVFYDYLNRYDWNLSSGAWSSGSGTVVGGASGPVSDGETAAHVATQYAFLASQDLVLNTKAGTLAIWANTDSDANRQGIVRLEAVGGNSKVWINAMTVGSSECFEGRWTNSAAVDVYTPQACGYVANSWHRLALTWSAGVLTLYVDGVSKGTSPYSGTLDKKAFYYSLFPQSYDNGKQMTLAKVTLANQAWTGLEVSADYTPAFPAPPTGGVLVTSTQLGTIHKDVLGAVDLRSLMTTAPLINGLKTGYTAAGITSSRYANGASGIWADLTNWNGGTTGVACGANLSQQATPGHTQPSVNAASLDTTDTFVPQIGQPLGLSLGYTVNYGTNPPLCNAGGDPVANGANLVQYLNVTKHYGFKYFEIGNELYDSNAGGLEADFHVNPAPADANGAIYGKNEQAFFSAMKAVDPTIKIGIPIGINNVFGWIQTWSLPALDTASYDAAVYHDYPVNDPVTDGSTLYPERVAGNLDRSLGDLRSLQTMLLNAGKTPDAIWVTEWGAMSHGGGMWTLQSMGPVAPLYVTMRLAEYMNSGVQWATYFAQAGDSQCSPYNIDYQSGTVYSWSKNCSNSALIYPGSDPNNPSEVNVGLKPGDLYPAGRGFQLLAQSGFVSEGEHMLKTFVDDTNAPWLAAYGATHGSSYAVILVNRDRDASHVVPVQLAGKSSGASVQQWTYGRTQYDHTYFGNWSVPPLSTVTSSWSGKYQATLPPWSATVLIFNP